VEVKRRNLIDECGIGYLHFNFLVKGLDGKNTMFFAEVHHDLEDENDVYLCKPLEEEDMKPSKKNDEGIFTLLFYLLYYYTRAPTLKVIFSYSYFYLGWPLTNALLFLFKLSVKGVNMVLKILYIPVVVASVVGTRMFVRCGRTAMTMSVIMNLFRPPLDWV
jgi:hypothetical protein